MKKLLALFAVVLAGCGLIAGTDPLNVDPCYNGCDGGGEGGIDATIDAPIEGGSDAGTDVITTDSGCPASMIAVPANPKYCVDSTEVTFAEYGKFVTAKGSDTSGQIAVCAANTSYAPSIIGSGSIPVRNVDWCDAMAYCTWAGKRLCGKIGGGSVPQSDFENPAINQWLYACSAGGTQPFPYGSTYQSGACNTDLDAGAPVAVGSKAKCEGGFPGIFDMIGNVWEFIDAPDTTNQTVLIYGAAWSTTDPTFDCSTGFAFPFSSNADDVGFRCCSP